MQEGVVQTDDFTYGKPKLYRGGFNLNLIAPHPPKTSLSFWNNFSISSRTTFEEWLKIMKNLDVTKFKSPISG